MDCMLMLTLIFADLSVSARGHELNGDIQHESPQERIPMFYSQLAAFFTLWISTYLSNRDHENPAGSFYLHSSYQQSP